MQLSFRYILAETQLWTKNSSSSQGQLDPLGCCLQLYPTASEHGNGLRHQRCRSLQRLGLRHAPRAARGYRDTAQAHTRRQEVKHDAKSINMKHATAEWNADGIIMNHIITFIFIVAFWHWFSYESCLLASLECLHHVHSNAYDTYAIQIRAHPTLSWCSMGHILWLSWGSSCAGVEYQIWGEHIYIYIEMSKLTWSLPSCNKMISCL